MRFALRLPPLALALAAAPALADDRKPENWALCPVADVIPAFAGAPATASDPAKARAERAELETRIDADSQTSDGVQSSYDGNVVLVRGDQYLRADDLQANQDEGSYVATRGVRYQDSGMRIVADRVQGNMYTENHQLDNVRYQLVDRRGNGGAERIVMGGSSGQLANATYSACDPSAQHWELKARSIDVDTDTGWGVARGASVRIGSVPVLYVPWIKFPVDEQRHTGLLYPSVSLSGRNGFDWRQPVYLNLAPNYDATLTPRWMSDRGLQLGAQGRWLYENGRGTIDAAWMDHDDLVDRRVDDVANGSYNPLNDPLRSHDRGMLRFSASHDLNPVWQARAQGQWVSDSRYLEDMGGSGNGGIAQAAISSSVGLYGTGRFWNAGVMADVWQNSDYRYDDSILAYNRLPRAWFAWERPFARWLQPGLEAEVAHFQHNTLGDGSRLDLKPSLSLPLQGASWYLTPSVAWRYTAYDLEPELADAIARRRAAAAGGIAESAVTPGMLAAYRNATPSRSLPITSLDAGLFFDRDTEIKGDRYLHTLEPRLFYLRVPYHDQTDQPIFDSRALTFSWGQLFRDNRYSGADRQSDANQLTLALSTRLLRQRDGHERLSLSFGQIRYFEDSRVAVLANEVPIEQGKSAWVADASYAPTDRWTIGTSYQWNPKYNREDLASLRARYLFPDDGVINLTYRYRRNLGDGSDLLKQADFSFLYPVNPNWSIVGRYYYSLLDNQILETLGGVQWDSCCLAVRVLARRYVRSREGEMNNALGFEFELKGLGSAGRDTGRTLRRAILGYYRDDLYLAPPGDTGFDPDENDSRLDGLP